MWVLGAGNKPRFSLRVSSALNSRATSPAPKNIKEDCLGASMETRMKGLASGRDAWYRTPRFGTESKQDGYAQLQFNENFLSVRMP